MRAWMLPAGSDGFDKLYIQDLPDPVAGPGEVLIAPQAWTINYRDFAVASGKYFGGALKQPSIPLSDGAGEVVAVGEGVTSVAVGDRVQGSFFLDWVDGPMVMGRALGDGMGPGMLAELVVLPEQGVVKIAESLDYSQAACLPCAGVTAWNALTRGRMVRPGDKVLVLGTGGVSMIALQLAKAMGAEVICTSSSDEKLSRAKNLGADHLINYKTTPDWGAAVKSQFGGANQVVEVGGVGTLAQSMQALANEGEIALIGVLSQGEPPSPHALMMTGGTLRGIFVGSAEMARDLNDFIDSNEIEPPIGGRFSFDKAAKAYAHAWGPDSFGKTVIEL
ncbi:NAD(P)-dependent alcohol dehydrogenase [Alteraurantiacibacter aestuarii]|uniref:Zinc-binding dehydrogenase n=1 Tax=Alteraurantiacibacter aestuarii TaxID=650004 RepID=A0A844ZRP8_9SPHN|nr:NAD(P)-dependent alcohol dehydrogenase [Alteraurantiacibacter aestuarii]MXO88279.1 zinc-binding dehydrogenase [Alteraurantiacibacter aestuarii]